VASADQRALRDVASSLPGVDVVQRSDDTVVYRSLLDASTVSIEQSLRQLQFVADAALRRRRVSSSTRTWRRTIGIEERATEGPARGAGRPAVRALAPRPGRARRPRRRSNDIVRLRRRGDRTRTDRRPRHDRRNGRRTATNAGSRRRRRDARGDGRRGTERSRTGDERPAGRRHRTTACDVLDSCECVDVSRFDQLDDDAPAWLGVVFRSLADAVEASGAMGGSVSGRRSERRNEASERWEDTGPKSSERQKRGSYWLVPLSRTATMSDRSNRRRSFRSSAALRQSA